jgi:hypothetical protein
MPNVRIDVCQCYDLRQGHDGEWGSPCGSDVLAVLSSRYKTHVPLKGDMSVYKCILIATDGSALAKKAEAVCLQLAKTLNAEAIAVTVTEPADALSMSALAERTMSNPIGNYEDSVTAAVNRIFFALARPRWDSASPAGHCM